MLDYLKPNFLRVSTCNSVMMRVLGKTTEGQGIALPRAHGRLFAGVVIQPRRHMAVRTDGERNARLSHFPHDLAQYVRYTSTR